MSKTIFPFILFHLLHLLSSIKTILMRVTNI